jgi:hypothetical protein
MEEEGCDWTRRIHVRPIWFFSHGIGGAWWRGHGAAGVWTASFEDGVGSKRKMGKWEVSNFSCSVLHFVSDPLGFLSPLYLCLAFLPLTVDFVCFRLNRELFLGYIFWNDWCKPMIFSDDSCFPSLFPRYQLGCNLLSNGNFGIVCYGSV